MYQQGSGAESHSTRVQGGMLFIALSGSGYIQVFSICMYPLYG